MLPRQDRVLCSLTVEHDEAPPEETGRRFVFPTAVPLTPLGDPTAAGRADSIYRCGGTGMGMVLISVMSIW